MVWCGIDFRRRVWDTRGRRTLLLSKVSNSHCIANSADYLAPSGAQLEQRITLFPCSMGRAHVSLPSDASDGPRFAREQKQHRNDSEPNSSQSGSSTISCVSDKSLPMTPFDGPLQHMAVPPRVHLSSLTWGQCKRSLTGSVEQPAKDIQCSTNGL
jgi:hypothetical protein